MPLNLNTLFNYGPYLSFLNNISPVPREEKSLKEAKNVIQQHLKSSIPKWLEEQMGENPNIVPRFRPQGSWSYKTCNAPCWPNQEMDFDLGVYLPVSLWDDNDIHPKAAAKGYYRMILELMTPLAEENNWTLSEKHTCVRVTLNNGTHAHVDLPLYAAPNEQFHQILESRMNVAFANRLAFDDSVSWDTLSRISLACKDGTWNPSDPGKVVVWFNKKLDRHGSQLRRICRYLKAWRDHVWMTGGPSSILLMVCATQTLDQAKEDFTDRDDLALNHVLKSLPVQIGSSVIEPMIDLNEDLNRLTPSDRQKATSEALNFQKAMNLALDSNISECDESIRLIQNYLGERFPNNPTVVVQTDKDSTSDNSAYLSSLIATKREPVAVHKNGGGRFA